MPPTNGRGAIHDAAHNPEGENHSHSSVQPPLFERLVSEEVQELKSYARIIESQNRRLAELERVHGDLEARLEVESRGKIQLESTLELRARQWGERVADLEVERDHWRELVQVERAKNTKLLEQIVRKDQEIQKMLQKKYDHQHENSTTLNASSRSSQGMQPRHNERADAGATAKSLDMGIRYHSPQDILIATGSMEPVATRNAVNLLKDFFRV